MSRVWIPVIEPGRPTQELAFALTRQSSQPMTRDLYHSLLKEKLVSLVEAEESREEINRMIEDLVPEYPLILTHADPPTLVDSVMQVESMGDVIRKINWEASPRQIPQREAKESMSEQNLMMVLEELEAPIRD